MGVVIDSSIFIAAERRRFDWIGFHSQMGAEPFYLTVVTLAELVHGAQRADSQERRETRNRFIAEIEARYPLLEFGRDEAMEYAGIWAELSVRGEMIGTHDLLIAAISRRHGYRVATLNGNEFRHVENLEIVDAEPFRLAKR